MAIIETMPQVDPDVPRTGDELKRIKKAAREKSVENIEKQFVSSRSSATPGTSQKAPRIPVCSALTFRRS